MSNRATSVEHTDVLCDDTAAGRLERTPTGSRFTYESKFLARCQARGWGLGFAVPMQPVVETAGVNLHSFFAGLLPEGIRLEALIRNTKTSPDDLFSLLLASGPETIGDVRVVTAAHDIDPAPLVDFTANASISFERVFNDSLSAVDGFSIPGVQPKVSAQMITLHVSSKAHSDQSTRPALLKLEPPNLPRLVHNEAFFMRAARDCGLEVVDTALVFDSQGQPGLLVERFDRRHTKPRRLHTEDGCQLLNRYAADKYRVSFQDLIRAVSEVVSSPPLELVRLLEQLAFSYLIANGDLHARNVSVYVAADGTCRLAPAYDVLSTLPYGDQRLALKTLGRDDNLKRKHFHELATQFAVNRPSVNAMLDRLCDTIVPWVAALEEVGLDARKTMHLRRTMLKRREDLG